MLEPARHLRDLLARVRRRRRTLVALRAGAVAAARAAAIIAPGLAAWWIVRPQGLALVALVVPVLLLAIGAAVWALRPLRARPSDRQIARLIEERCPEFEDALATAVEHQPSPTSGSLPFVDSMWRELSARLQTADPDRIVDRRVLRRGAATAAAALLALAALAVPFSRPVVQAGSIAALYLFPARVTFVVTPGDVRLRAGERLAIAARLPGGTTGVVPTLEVVRGSRRQASPMRPAPGGGFAVTMTDLQESFAYRVKAGSAASREYAVTVLHAPRVARIDVHYAYPASAGLKPRVDEDSGDVFGPTGTRVRLVVRPDKPVTSGELALGDGRKLPLAKAAGGVFEASLTITEDGSYRVALGDADGLRNPGDTEYFIRTLEDRPPDVRIVKPAGDRQVSPVEEVTIQARADDDYGLAQFDLVYSVRGAAEQVVPFAGTRAGLTASGERTLYLEELAVQPGDFVTYYARARDIGRGKPSAEARSDIFFLEVKPFEEEFVASQSLAAQGAAATPIDDLAQTQKEIIVATWKLDRRSRPARGRSEPDIRSVARAQGELKKRAQAAAGALALAARDLRRRGPRPALPAAAGEGVGDALPRAIDAMGKAQGELDRLSTSAALPHEMTALNELLRAQAEIRRRQVQRQQGRGSGRFQNRDQQDLSTLFDRELRREQTTNYESPNITEAREDSDRDEALDKLRELARRQTELNDQQRALAERRDRLDEEEVRRQLERLTRDQNELRRQTEELAQQLARQQGQQGSQSKQPNRNAQGQGTGSGQSADGRSGGRSQEQTQALREASEAMGDAAGDLRRQDPKQASARGSRAVDKLRQLEEALRGERPDDRRRAVGDLQLESRQLADAQRQLAGQARRGAGQGDADTGRRLAGEQERLAWRADRLGQAARQLAARAKQEARAGKSGASPGEASRPVDEALDKAARQLERERLGDRMRESARALRQQGAVGTSGQPNAAGDVDAREDMARALDKIADQLAAAGRPSGESGRLSEQLARARDLRGQVAELDRRLREVARAGGSGERGQPTPDQQGQPAGQAPSSGQESRRGSESGNQGGTSSPAAGTEQTDLRQRLRETRELLDKMRRDHPEIESAWRGGEGLKPGLSAPGTEAFKQDFAGWETLKKNLAAALEQVETTLSSKLRDRDANDRLHAGGSDAVPDAYRSLVDRYYRALADKKKPQ